MGLISTEVEVAINNRVVKYYENLGYKIPKNKKGKEIVSKNTKIIVKVNDLPFGSHTSVNVKCDFCDKEEYKTIWKDYITSSNKNNGLVSCKQCHDKQLGEKRRNNYKNITGLKFGYLTSLYIDKDRIENIKNNNQYASTYWLCQCDCENENLISVSIGSLQSGMVKSCGCIQNHPYKENLTSKKFGKLTVISFEENKSIETCHNYYLCKCDCENPNLKSVRSAHLKSGEIRSCGCMVTNKMSDINGWVLGHYTSEDAKQRNSIEYKKWREEVFKRDNYICQCCEERGGKLNAHHLENFADNQELRLNIDNGITLCENCHSPNISGSFHNLYGTHNNTKEQYEEFIKIKELNKNKEMVIYVI